MKKPFAFNPLHKKPAEKPPPRRAFPSPLVNRITPEVMAGIAALADMGVRFSDFPPHVVEAIEDAFTEGLLSKVENGALDIPEDPTPQEVAEVHLARAAAARGLLTALDSAPEAYQPRVAAALQTLADAVESAKKESEEPHVNNRR